MGGVKLSLVLSSILTGVAGLPGATIAIHAHAVGETIPIFDATCHRDTSSRWCLPTPINANKLKQLLYGYDESLRQFLVDGFTIGFRIVSSVLPLGKMPSNLKSASEYAFPTREKINKEIQAGRLLGPYTPETARRELGPFFCSPIGVVPKKDGKFRLIHHLSHPLSNSLNSHIPPDLCSVQYASVDDAVSLILQTGMGSYMAKTDVKDAFRLLPISPQDYHLLGLHFDGLLYFDRCLPMGCSLSCNYFECFSTALQWIAKTYFGISMMTHILDDFFFVSSSREGALKDLQSFLSLCNYLGVPLAQDKTVGPEQTLSFLGIELDTAHMCMRLPRDKVEKCQLMVNEALGKNKITLRALQSLLGSLNFASQVVHPGRAFLRRLYDLTIKARAPHHMIRLTVSAKEDLKAWLSFLQHFNGKVLMLRDVWVSSDLLDLYTDSSGSIGFGAVLGRHWCYGTWPKAWLSCNIALLELFPIVLAVHLWASVFADKKVVFYTDNIAVCAVVNKMSSKDPQIMCLIRALVVQCMKLNLLFKCEHVEGARNDRADALSRSQIDRFQRLSPLADAQPTPVPEHLHPNNWRII